MTSSMKARRRPRLMRKATMPWLCGGGSEVDVVLPERCTPPRTLPGKTRIKADVQESRLSRSATTSTSASRAGRNKGSRKHAAEERPATRVGHRDGLRDDANEEEYQKQRQKQQGNGLPGFRRRRSSDPAQLRHDLNWELQALRRSTSSSAGRRGPSRRSCSIDASAAIQRQEKQAPDNNPVNPSFNLGIGAALLFLLARGATEFHKIVELRKDAEALLTKIQDAVARLETISPAHRTAAQFCRDTGDADAVKPGFSATTLSSSSSTVNKEMITTDCFFPESTSASPVLSCHSSKRMFTPHHSDDACSISGIAADSQARMMEQLEAELQSELQRLEFTLGTNEDPQDPAGLQEFKNKADFMREYAVMPWSKGIKYEPSSLLRENSEEEEEDMHDHHQYNGVCPYRLERRLRDLLETRQLECVEYPEYALQSPEGGLQVTEMEIPMWRNEARSPCQLAHPVVGH